MVDQLSHAAEACLSADVLLFASLAPFLLHLTKTEPHLKKEAEKGPGLLQAYFPASSPFHEWLIDGHGAYAVRRYGGKDVVRMLEQRKQSEQEAETEADKATKGRSEDAKGNAKKKKERQKGNARQIEAQYIEGLLADPMNLPFELERHFSAEEFYSIYAARDEDIRKAVVAGTVESAAAPAPAAVQQILQAAESYLRTVKGCAKTGHRMIQQLQALLGDAPAIEVLLHYAESMKANRNLKPFLWRILMGMKL